MASLVRQIIDLRIALSTHSASNESAQIARLTLNDLIDRSGIDLAKLETLLTEVLGLARMLPGMCVVLSVSRPLISPRPSHPTCLAIWGRIAGGPGSRCDGHAENAFGGPC